MSEGIARADWEEFIEEEEMDSRIECMVRFCEIQPKLKPASSAKMPRSTAPAPCKNRKERGTRYLFGSQCRILLIPCRI